MKNKLLVLFLLGVFLISLGSIVEAKKDGRVFLKTIGYVTQSEPVSYGNVIINGVKFRTNIDVRARCENCKFHRFIDGPGLFRIYGTFENNGVSIEVKNLRITDVVFGEESSVIKGTAIVIRYVEDQSREVSQREPITINTYKDYFEIVFEDGQVLGKFYTKIIY